ncbi:non-ribosomal peptide synthetase [Fusarium beomiforme]|uniref:Non-ribosomal peptide synthetase n=1 Tax=Fusarium beomiforme TaxID=44412 RepID=A0A9P5DT80_9HYPO|nr:non-ribosomal peptide synthetase [Fusarium beomiforme]
MAGKQIFACNLEAFAGRDTSSTDINKQIIDYPVSSLSHVTVEAAWCVTLHLYTGLDRVSFEAKYGDGSVATKFCDLQPQDTLRSILSDVEHCNVRDQAVHEYNTAIVFKQHVHDDTELPEPLRPGIDVLVEVTDSQLCILARGAFMAAGETRNLGQTFNHVLKCFEKPEQAVRDVGISDNDATQIMSWNSGILTSVDSLIHDQFGGVVNIHPEKSAIESWDGNMTYQELDAASTSLAGYLSQRNVGPGSWVLFCFNKSRWAIVSMLAIIKAGGACVPLDPRHPKARIDQIIEAIDAQHILVGQTDMEISSRFFDEFASLQVIPVPHGEVPETQSLDTKSLTFDSPAIGIFTSGSTGTPKGIIATHATVCTGASSYAYHIGANHETRILQFSSYTFDVCMVDVFTALLHGGTLCIPSEEERMTNLQDYIVRTQPNWAALTPTVARILDPVLSSKFLRKLLLVGEMVRESDIDEWVESGVMVYNVYGPAENNLITTAAQVVKGKASSVGIGINTHTWVGDFERERLVPIGAVGELLCAGPHLTPGYLNDPERTASSFFEEPSWIPSPSQKGPISRRFYRSGDLVRYCHDGSLQCVGRLDSQVKLGGQRVELSDIESHIESHSAAVLFPSAGPLKKKLVAVLEVPSATAQPRDASSSISLSHCTSAVAGPVEQTLRKSLPSYMCPSIWLIIEHLPSSASGKLDKKVLMAELEALSHAKYLHLVLENAEGGANISQGDDHQQLLRQVCSQVLNIPVERIAMTRSFAGHGGDSITAMQASSLIRRTQNSTIAVKDLLTCPTLFEAASRIREDMSLVRVPAAEPGKLYSLSPIQRLFMVTAPTSATWNHYNQSVLLRLRERKGVDEVRWALTSLVSRHAMLRARFERSSSGEWMQRILAECENSLAFEYFPDVIGSKQREAIMLRARESLDIERGPLLRAQLFDGQGDQGMILFIVSHHLIVDLVSWRVMIEEVEESLALSNTNGRLIERGEALSLRSSQLSLSFLAWSELQHEAAKEMIPDRTIPPVSSVPGPDFSYWGISPGRNVYRDVVEKRVSLGNVTTKNVLYECHEALQTEPVDVFLAAILLSFKRAFPERPTPPIFDEGHGREPWNSSLDVSRTVGWFTTMFPIYVSNISTGDVIDTVRRVKDFRKGTAENGFQYFSTKYLHEEGRKLFKDHIPAEIMFNYEGRYQSLERDQSLLMAEDWSAGEALSDSAPELQRFCIFELSAAVLTDGELHFTMAWNSRARYQERISLWLTRLLPAVIDEIVTYLMLEKRQFTLSDLDQTGLSSYSDLDTLMASVLTIPGIDSIEGVEDIYCGSPMQNSLALSQSRTEDDAYEIDLTWEVIDTRQENSIVDANRLMAAWNDVVGRHAALRTVFLEASTPSGNNMIHQVVLKKFRPHTILIHAQDSSTALERLANSQSYKKKSLLVDKIPPHLLTICSTAQGRTFVRFQVNHIIFDGSSIFPLLQDLSRAYKSNWELRTEWSWNPMADFIRYVRDEKRRSDDLAYWTSYLARARPCYFPALKDEKATGSSHFKQDRSSVQVPLTFDAYQLRQFLAEMGVTVPTLVQLVWALVLRMYTADSQVMFGYLASGRDAPVDNIDQAVGPFIAVLFHVLDFYEDGEVSIAEMLQRVHDRSAQSISHQSCSLAEIQGALGVPGKSLLFNSGISFMPKWTREMQLQKGSALVFEQIASHDPTEFDISLIVEFGGDVEGLSIYIDYRTATIGHTHAANAAASFDYLLSQITLDPSIPLNRISGISTRDFQQISNWNQQLTPQLDKCLHDMFTERAIKHPEREAVSSWDGSMSYGQLHDLSSRLANYLIRLGIGPEKMVPLCFEKSMWTIVTVLAVLKAGGCFVLLDPAHPESRIWGIIEEIEGSILLCSPLTNKSKKLETSAQVNGLQVLVLEIKSSFINSLPLPNSESPRASVSPDDAAYVVFTSGTTGTPKGVVVTHRAIVAGLDDLGRAAGMAAMGPETRTLQFASYAFDASIGDIFCTLQVGGCVCVMSEDNRSPADLTDFIQRSRATYAGITPSFASLLDPSTVPSLRVLCLSGEALSASQIEAWSGHVKIINMYGPTEATVACIAKSEVSKTTAASNIGRAFRGVTWIVDENNHDQLRPVGAPGELLIEGPILAREYLKRPQQSAQAFITGPAWLRNIRPNSRLYKTGDVVRYNTDGTINYIGRKDNQIKINGQRVEVAEIEETLRAAVDGEVGPIVVELLKRMQLGESDVLAAFICLGGRDSTMQREQHVSEKEPVIISHNPQLLDLFQRIISKLNLSSSKLPRYMVPQAFIPISTLPLTTSGKVDRRALQQAAAQLSRTELFAFASSSDMDEDEGDSLGEEEAIGQLAVLWQAVLGVQVKGKQSNFFRLGGNSMAAMNLRAEARKVGIQLSVADILANPTLSYMAKAMVVSPSKSSQSMSSSDHESLARSTITTPSEVEFDATPFSLLQDFGISLDGELWQQITGDAGLPESEVEDVFPCTPMQEGLMVLSAHRDEHGAYALHAPFKLPGDLDRERFKYAWQQTTMTHPILRSRIIPNSQCSLVVQQKSPVTLKECTSSTLGEFMEGQSRNAFSYGSPLFRMTMVFEKSTQLWYFVISIHHALFDGWSFNLMWNTAIELYKGSPVLHRQPSFQSFVQQLMAEPLSSSREYWKKYLVEQDRDSFQFPVVPSAHKPIATASATFEFSFHSTIAMDAGVTPSVIINAAWALLLSQYTASSVVTFGITLSGRDLPMHGLDQVVGPTIVTVPRQFTISPNQTVMEFLDYIQHETAATIPHQHLGLQEIRGLGLDAQQACNFNSLILINHETINLNDSIANLGIVPITVDSVDLHPYPLAVEFTVQSESLRVNVNYDPVCIGDSLVSHVMQQFYHLLQSLCQSCTGSNVLSFPKTLATVMTGVAPTHQESIVRWNEDGHRYGESHEKHFAHDQISIKGRENPDDQAVVAYDATLSYADLDRLADLVSEEILQQPITGEFIGVCFDKSAAAIVSMLAILKSGFAFMPLGPSQPPARLESLLVAADIHTVLTNTAHTGLLSTLPLQRRIIPVDLNQVVQRDVMVENSSCHPVDESRAAYLLYTSGTTGQPKGVVVQHGAWSKAIASQVDFFGFNRDTRMLQFSNYTFDASIFEIFATLCSGGCLFIPSEQSRFNDLEGYISNHNLNTLTLTPTVARVLHPEKLLSVRQCLFGGESLTQNDVIAWVQHGRRVTNCYGPTEACVFTCGRDIDPNATNAKSTNIGRPVGINAWIISPLTGSICPIGAPGELYLEGKILARGYLNDPERTRLSFSNTLLDSISGKKQEDRAYRTGDIVSYEVDGTLNFLGRRDGQIKIRGQRIDMGEIEHHIQHTMAEDPSYQSNTVQIYRRDGKKDSEIELAVLLKMDISHEETVLGVPCSLLSMIGEAEKSPKVAELQFKLRRLLPEYMIPNTFIAVDHFPTTTSGKLDKNFAQRCIEGFLARHQQTTIIDENWSETEALIRQWWSTILGIDVDLIGRHANFFALGGNSIHTIRLVGLARNKNYNLQYEHVFSCPILHDMASLLSTAGNNHEDSGPQLVPEPFELISGDDVKTIIEKLLPLHNISKDEVEDIYPCTSLQASLMAETARRRGAYILVESIKVHRSQMTQFQDAWLLAFKAYDILRTRIVLSHDGNRGAWQVVMKSQPLRWTEFPDAASFVEFVYDTHDYGSPLVHLVIIRNTNDTSEDTVKFGFGIHHAAYDGWSLSNIWRNIIQDASATTVSSIHAHITPFKSYVRHIIQQNLEQARAYWQERLLGLSNSRLIPPSQNLGHQPSAPDLIQRTLELPTIRDQIHLQGKTAVVAQAAWAMTISHYTAMDDTLFGTILSGRESAATSVPGIETIVGPTITTVPCRTIINYDSSVSDLFATVQDDNLNAIRFAHLGLEQISRISQDCRQACQFDTIFLVQPPFEDSMVQEPLGIVRQTINTRGFFFSSMVVEVQLSPDGQRLTITMSFDPVTVSSDQVQMMLDTYITIAENLFCAPQDTLVRSIPALSPRHLEHIRAVSGSPPESVEACVHDLVRNQVELSPFLTAIDSWDGSMTYAELDDLSTSLAERLSHLGIRPEKAVCVLFEKSKWAVVAMLGIVKAGGFFVPLNPENPEKRLQVLAESVNASVILTSRDYKDLATSLSLPQTKVLVVSQDALPLPTSAFLKAPFTFPIAVRPRNTAYILFTSGSTGLPKGVVIEHQALCSSLTALTDRIGMSSHSRTLQFNAYWFDGMLLEIFGTLIVGGTVCVLSESGRMNDLAGSIQDLQANTITTLATSVSRLIEPSKVSCLQTVCMGGEPVLPSDRDRWASKVRLLSVYGPTETCIIMLVGNMTCNSAATLLGQPVGSRVWVVNPLKGDELAPIGGIGELFIEGPGLARHYLNDEDKSAASFVTDQLWMIQCEETQGTQRVYRTGDLARISTDGTLSWVGRKDSSQVKIRGQRVELAEIEETIRQHIPHSLTVAVDVFTPSSDDQRQMLGAVFGTSNVLPETSIQVESYMDKLTSDLIPKLQGLLPRHMVPTVFVPLPALPFLSTALEMSKGTAITDGKAPETVNEKILSDLWAEVLGTAKDEPAGRTDNFFNVGGDSMMAMRLVALARYRGVALSVVDIFKNPILSEMATLLDHEEAPSTQESEDALVDDWSSYTSAAKEYLSHESIPIPNDSIEQIYPCTGIQEMFLAGTEVWPGSHVTQWIFSLDNGIDILGLREAIDHCIMQYPTMRTRIVRHSQTGQHIQLVFHKGYEAPWSVFLTDDLDSALEQERRGHWMHSGLGKPLQRISLVQNSSGLTHLIWSLNHAAYDAWSLGMMLRSVGRYHDTSPDQSQPTLPFGGLIRHVTKLRGEISESRRFWETYLLGIGPQPLLFKYSSIKDPCQDRFAAYQLSFPKREGKTSTSLITAAWIVLLAQLTHQTDVTIAYLVTGRTLPLGGIDNCPGPLISKLPLRIQLPGLSPDLGTAADLVRKETVRVMPHEHAGLDALQSLAGKGNEAIRPHAASLLGCLPFDLAIHPAGHTNFNGARGTGMAHVGQRVVVPPPGAFSAECSVVSEKDDIAVSMAMIWDDRAMNKDDVDGVIQMWQDIVCRG